MKALVLSLLILSQDAFAQRCVEEIWTPLHTEIRPITECLQGEKLERIRVSKTYPKMNNETYMVEIWTGSYGRTIVVIDHYLRELYDRCNAKAIDTRRIQVPHRKLVSFPIENPNISDDVAASYELVPMIEEEAVAALEVARLVCVAWRPSMSQSSFKKNQF